MEFVRTDGGDEPAVDAGFETLTRRLWRTRRLLETLVFKLEVERLLLEAGQVRWIAAAAMEVGVVLDRIADEDLALELAPPPVGGGRARTLRALIEAAPSPWDHILDDHHQVLTESLAEATSLASDNADWLRPGELRWARSGDDDGGCVGGFGGVLGDDLLTRRAQERALEAAVAASARVSLPALRSFLG